MNAANPEFQKYCDKEKLPIKVVEASSHPWSQIDRYCHDKGIDPRIDTFEYEGKEKKIVDKTNPYS